MKLVKILALILCLGMQMSICTTFADEVFENENFDSVTALASNWNNQKGTELVNLQDYGLQKHANDKGVRFSNSSVDSVSAKVALTKKSGLSLVIEANICVKSDDVVVRVFGLSDTANGSGKPLAGNGLLNFWHGKINTLQNKQVTSSYELGKWYNYKIVLDLAVGTADIYIDNKKVTTGTMTPKTTGAASFDITTAKKSETGSSEVECFIDDIKISGSGGGDIANATPAPTKAPVPTSTTQPADGRMNQSVVLFVGNSSAYVNEKKTQIDTGNAQVKPVIINSRTLVPVRFVSESMGAQVGWDQLTSTITIQLADKTIKMKLNELEYDVNGSKKALDVPPQIISDRTFIPLRAMVEALGKQVFWDNRGLIIISNTADLFNPATEKQLIDKIVQRFN